MTTYIEKKQYLCNYYKWLIKQWQATKLYIKGLRNIDVPRLVTFRSALFSLWSRHPKSKSSFTRCITTFTLWLLRSRRVWKPLALMPQSIKAIKRLCYLGSKWNHWQESLAMICSPGDALWRSLDQDARTTQARHSCDHDRNAAWSRRLSLWIWDSLWYHACSDEGLFGRDRSTLGQRRIGWQVCWYLLFNGLAARWSRNDGAHHGHILCSSRHHLRSLRVCASAPVWQFWGRWWFGLRCRYSSASLASFFFQILRLQKTNGSIFFSHSNGDGSRKVSQKELEIAKTQGENFGRVVSTFVKGKTA